MLTANILKAGYPAPAVVNVQNPRQVGRMGFFKVGLCTVNDVQTFEALRNNYLTFSQKCGSMVIGGQLPSRAPEKFLEAFPGANIFVGECEGSMGKVLESVERGIRDVVWEAAPVDIFSDYLLPVRGNRRIVWPVELGRGCKRACPYCPLPPSMRRVRERDSEQVVEEIESLKNILFVDPNLMAYSYEYLYKIFYFIAKHKKTWGGEGVIVDALRLPSDLFDLMFRTCIGFMVGVEDPELYSLHQGKFDGRLLPTKHGYVRVYSFILGHPEQKVRHFRRMLDLVRSNSLTAVFHIYSPFCGTPDYEKAKRNGMLLNSDPAHFNRRQVAVRGSMAPVRAKELFMRVRRKAFTLSGTLQEAMRILRDSDHYTLAFFRVVLLLGLRLIPFRIKKSKHWYKK
ncbi:MAG: hypothetical protein WC659_01600 [Patescibacteria group bacterium]